MMARPLLVLSVMVLAACRGGAVDEAPGHDLRLSIAPTPPIEGTARIVAELRDDSGEPVDGAEIVLRGDMAHAGMIPVEEPLVEESGGRYSTSAFPFNMGGDWILTAQITLPDGRRMERTREVRVVSSAGREGGP